MAEILLIRHAHSDANNGGDLAFGNREARLTPRGLGQVALLRQKLIEVHHIIPEEYPYPVFTSNFRRAFQTAAFAGFRVIRVSELLDEIDDYASIDLGRYSSVVERHASEGGWFPEEEIKRSGKLQQAILNGELGQIQVSHGTPIGLVKMGLNKLGYSYPFDPIRGYIPKQGEITAVNY